MKIYPLSEPEIQAIQNISMKGFENSARINELALALHLYADFKMIGGIRNEGGLKEVYAYDVSRRVYKFNGPGKTIDDQTFHRMRQIDEEAVRNLYVIDEVILEKIALVAQALWPRLPWNAKSNIRKVALFADELQKLCETHNISLRTPSPFGVTIGELHSEEIITLYPSTFPGEFHLKREFK